MKRRLTFATLLAVGIVATLFSACVLAARGDDEPGDRASTRRSKNVARRAGKGQADSSRRRIAWPISFTPGDLAADQGRPPGDRRNQNQRRRADDQVADRLDPRCGRFATSMPHGNITFDNSVERVEMWNSVEGRQEVHYDSAIDKTPPAEFATVAASVGKVLATIKIDPHGRILDRNNAQAQFNPGIGELTIPFPRTCRSRRATPGRFPTS